MLILQNRAVVTQPSGGGGGAGFITRPYFFQQDSSRLAGYVSGSTTEWSGSATNTGGVALGFGTLMSAAYTNASGGGTSYNDIFAGVGVRLGNFWQIALWAYLSGNTTAQDWCVARVMDIVATGTSFSNDEYQHIEEVMSNSAMIGDLLYSRFSAGQLTSLATWCNACATDGETKDSTFWPYGDTHNNYNQNRLLSLAILGLCSEGWNASASSWRTKFETLAAVYVTDYNASIWTGPQDTEGSYYCQYIRNCYWAFRQYDYVMGTTFASQISSTYTNTLNMVLHQLRPNLGNFFHIGSQPATTDASWHTTAWAHWRQLAFQNGSSSVDAQMAKTLLFTPAVYASFEGRFEKGFWNFYWNVTGITGSALSAKTDRRLVLPTPGGAKTFLRSAQGWDTSGTTRAMVIFHHNSEALVDGHGPCRSHDNADMPGFQWGQNDNFIVTDPEYGCSGGTSDEGGTTIGNLWANCVTCAGTIIPPNQSQYCTLLFSEDNLGASVPHYYTAIDAQPIYTNTTIQKRHYVMLDDEQVIVIWDRVATSGTIAKTWRLNVDTASAPSLASGVYTVSIVGTSNITLKLYDLFATSGATMSATNLNGSDTVARDIYQIRQADSANDFVSLKVLGINGRLTAATLSTGTDGTGAYKQADMTINSVSRSVRFYDNGTSHCVVS